ncbi:MAG: Tex family protein [Chloroflexota bacterium]
MSSLAIEETIAAELSIRTEQAARTIELLDAGNTIPFIARYRKEATGGLDEVQIQEVSNRVEKLRNLLRRKEEVTRLIDEQGKLTPELAVRIQAAETLQEVNDLYLPYRPKRRTRASVAREKGLAPLADLILQQPVVGNPEDLALPFVNPDLGVETVEDALAGAQDIVAETIAEDAELRRQMRTVFSREATVRCRLADGDKDPSRKYADYYDFASPIGQMLPHRVLALNRAEKEGVLRIDVDLPEEIALSIVGRFFTPNPQSCLARSLRLALEDGYTRLLAPAMEREMRSELTERAERHAINVFAANLRPLLLQPPLRGRVVMGIDPGYRTGCKVAVVDQTGKYVAGTTIYPHAPQGWWDEAREAIRALVASHGVSVIAIGNGTASRETESLVAETIAKIESLSGERGSGAGDQPSHGLSPDVVLPRPDSRGEPALGYAIVSEAGASVYSASEVARKEFPDLDVAARGAVSIARRLQDPLAELVKVDPKSIGVGLYQHDVDQKELSRTLDAVVESCVNFAGVDVNTASASLLQYVAGINRRVAEAIVKFREGRGKFVSRQQLREVPGLGEAAFTQAAGFLKVPDGDNALDNTFIHPESYEVCRRLMERLGPPEPGQRLSQQVAAFRHQMKTSGPTIEQLASELGCGVPTLEDILANLEKPGLDPRDELPKPMLRRDVLKMEDLREGMVLQGTVRNVVDFGAFVDIGVKQDGLVHISQMADRFVRDPLSVVTVGQIVTVRVLSVDVQRGRISLSMRL